MRDDRFVDGSTHLELAVKQVSALAVTNLYAHQGVKPDSELLARVLVGEGPVSELPPSDIPPERMAAALARWMGVRTTRVAASLPPVNEVRRQLADLKRAPRPLAVGTAPDQLGRHHAAFLKVAGMIVCAQQGVRSSKRSGGVTLEELTCADQPDERHVGRKQKRGSVDPWVSIAHPAFYRHAGVSPGHPLLEPLAAQARSFAQSAQAVGLDPEDAFTVAVLAARKPADEPIGLSAWWQVDVREDLDSGTARVSLQRKFIAGDSLRTDEASETVRVFSAADDEAAAVEYASTLGVLAHNRNEADEAALIQRLSDAPLNAQLEAERVSETRRLGDLLRSASTVKP